MKRVLSSLQVVPTGHVRVQSPLRRLSSGRVVGRKENDKEPGGHQLVKRVPIRATEGVEQRRVIRKHRTTRRAPNNQALGPVRKMPSSQHSAE